jgi:serine/threonine protein phosphatase PrpC
MKSIAYSNIGQRTKNEDAFYESEKVFIVCDGVGGSPYGEVASKLACSSFSDFFHNHPTSVYDSHYLKKALRFSVEKFQEIETKHPETKGMSTTTTLFAFNENGAIVTWMGDSRLYHVREGKILFVTEDDSLINEMKRKGEDTKNVSRNFITKALSANCAHDLSNHVFLKEDIQPGDFIFLCTDGVLENMTDHLLCEFLSGSESIESKAKKILSLSEGKTKDNFTFQLIEVNL